MATGPKAELTLQNWGNSLAVRIPASVARAARLVRGQPGIVEAIEGPVVVRPAGGPARLTLALLINAYDPQRHGGEVVADSPRGAEFR